MGTSPASSEEQKRIRETICKYTNAIHIKDKILIYGVGEEQDRYLEQVLIQLEKKGITSAI